jgi:hypothetical protein
LIPPVLYNFQNSEYQNSEIVQYKKCTAGGIPIVL